MNISGIEKGDKNLRHFTFDDEDYVVRGGVYYYRVNYGKNPLEGEYGDEESGYVECKKVIPLGGRKPKPIPGLEVKSEPVVKMDEEPIPEVKKRGRKPKNDKTESISETTPVVTPGTTGTFEYYVTAIKAENITELQNQLNEKGNKGWELCGFDTNKTLFGSIYLVAIFKRKRG